jgi:hypothetical protein
MDLNTGSGRREPDQRKDEDPGDFVQEASIKLTRVLSESQTR